MKPALTLLFVAVVVTATSQVPQNVLKEFERIHPGAKYIEWKTEWGLLEDYYRVTYTSWFRQTLVFTREGTIVKSESELPVDYIPGAISNYMRKNFPRAKYVVWDSFDEQNNRSYFVICNESQKLLFTNECSFMGAVPLNKPKKQNGLLSIFIPKK